MRDAPPRSPFGGGGNCCPCCWSSVLSRHPRLSVSSHLAGLSWVRTHSGSPHEVDDRSGAKKVWRARSRTVGTDDSRLTPCEPWPVSHITVPISLSSRGQNLCNSSELYKTALCYPLKCHILLTVLFHFFFFSSFFFESCFQTNRTFLRVKRVKTERHGSILNKKVRFTMKFNAAHVI